MPVLHTSTRIFKPLNSEDSEPTLDGHLPDSQEDLGLPLQFNCSQEAKVIADHFARITSMLRDSTVLSVVNAVCNSEPVLGEFWSHE